MVDATEWPQGLQSWWWMRYRKSRRAKWHVLLVQLIERDGTEYVQPFQDRNCFARCIFSREYSEDWEASFVPAQPPPEEWHAT